VGVSPVSKPARKVKAQQVRSDQDDNRCKGIIFTKLSDLEEKGLFECRIVTGD